MSEDNEMPPCSSWCINDGTSNAECKACHERAITPLGMLKNIEKRYNSDNANDCPEWVSRYAKDMIEKAQPAGEVHHFAEKCIEPLPDDVQGALDNCNRIIQFHKDERGCSPTAPHLMKFIEKWVEEIRTALVAQNQVIDKPVCGECPRCNYPEPMKCEKHICVPYEPEQAIVNMGNLHPDTRRSIMDFSALPDEVYIQVETLSDNEREFSLSPVPSPPETVTGNIVEQRYVLPPAQETCKENPTQGGDCRIDQPLIVGDELYTNHDDIPTQGGDVGEETTDV